MKKLLSIILCTALVLSLFSIMPVTVNAAQKFTYGNWEYEVHSRYDSKTYESYDEIWLTNYTGDDEKVTIPNEIDGKPVVFLYNNYIFGNTDTNNKDDRHFKNHKTMTELTIPANMRYIAGWMLMDCTALETINISSENKYFEYKGGVLYAKQANKNYNDTINGIDADPDEYGVVFARFNMGVVNLPTSVTTIHSYAFYNHQTLVNCVMPVGKLKKIEDYAFYGSSLRGMENLFGITSVEIPYGVTEIGYSAFMYCKNIHCVGLPNTLKKIGAQAFLETSLTDVHVPSSVEEIGYQPFGYARSKVNIYASPALKAKIQEENNYQVNTDPAYGGGGGGAAQAIQLNHDPANPLSHIYIASTSIPPTCTTDGLMIYLCECGYQYFSENTILPATSHKWKTKKVYPTCTEQGYTLTYCENCGESSKSDFRKPYSHWKINDPAVEPTATTAGKTAGVHCGDCGLIIEPQKLLPPTGYTEKESGGVKVTAKPEATPTVNEITDEAQLEAIKVEGDNKVDKAYDIKLTEGGETVQPEGDVIVKIPGGDEKAKVFRQEEDGSLTDMKAGYNADDDAMEFVTDHFSVYVVTSHVPTAYDLWVNNEQITEDHLTVQCGEGTATFDPKEYTLTLDNAQITQGAEKDYLGTGILTFLDKELTVVVNGKCSITETGGDGIGSYEFDEDYNMVPHDIKVTGDGSLTITESTALYGYGFYCTGKLTLDGVDITINSAATGIWSKSLAIKNKSHILSQCSSRFSGIVVNNGGFNLEDSMVVAESTEGVGLLLGNDQDSSSLMLSSGSLTLRGQCGITSDSENSRVGVTGGTLTIEAVQRAISESISDKEGAIVLGEGVEVISGGYSEKGVVISDSKGGTESYILGDADGDGEVTINDVTSIQKKIADLEVENFNDKAADIGRDGLDITDATSIQRYLADYKDGNHIGELITE